MNEDRSFSDQRGERDIRSVGPFSAYPVMVNGWTVPNLEALYADDGTVYLGLDQRFGLDVPADLAGQVIEFVANATAIALGWSCHPTSPDWTPDNDVAPLRGMPWRRLHGIGTAEEEDPSE